MPIDTANLVAFIVAGLAIVGAAVGIILYSRAQKAKRLGWAAPPPSRTCIVCQTDGKGPLVEQRFGRHTGMLLLMQHETLHGPMCQECAKRTFWRFQAHTMAFGWWGMLSMFITPATIASNFVRARKLRAYPLPMVGRKA